ncbi:MAG TPA: DNA-directed RNA polymerase subunit alpha, partial [Bacteroidia bacterium]|nr:DNA-directed RNA polymerase subunit alpha [Bacteroidia bacterium]
MAILTFQKPDKVVMNHSSETVGEFEFRPLEPGYGVTIGNALRRILLSSLEGYAITSIKVAGVDHEFSTIKGVVEDVIEMVLNLKQVRFKRQIEGTTFEKVTVVVSGKEQFTAGDIAKHTTAFQVLNPELVICNMEQSVKLQLDITIDKGRGYVPAEENKNANQLQGTIPIDSIYTPIKNVKY